MKRALWSALALVVWAGCSKDNPKQEAPPPAPPVAAQASAGEAKVSDAIQLIRDADAAFQAGDLDKAIEKSEAALKIVPTHALALNVLGRAAATKYEATHEQKDADKARDAFTRAAQSNPTFWPAWQNLAELAEREGKPKDAAEYYKKVLAASPNHPDKARFEKLIAAAEGGGEKAPGPVRTPATPPHK